MSSGGSGGSLVVGPGNALGGNNEAGIAHFRWSSNFFTPHPRSASRETMPHQNTPSWSRWRNPCGGGGGGGHARRGGATGAQWGTGARSLHGHETMTSPLRREEPRGNFAAQSLPGRQLARTQAPPLPLE